MKKPRPITTIARLFLAGLLLFTSVSLAMYDPWTRVAPPEPLPISKVQLTASPPLVSYSLSDQRDTLIARWAKGQSKVPLWLALSISHAEVWSGDSTAVNESSGALGLFQIHPVNFGRYPECGEPIVNRKVNICYGFEILVECIEATDASGELRNESLAAMLACYGGATRASTIRLYVDAVARRVRTEWLTDTL